MTRKDAVLLIKAAICLALEEGSMLARIPVPAAAEIGRLLEREERQESQDGLLQNAERAFENGR